VEQLTTELSSLKISMHEREAELTAALRSSTDRLHLASSGPGACGSVCLGPGMNCTLWGAPGGCSRYDQVCRAGADCSTAQPHKIADYM
jgi:hypothetical protein